MLVVALGCALVAPVFAGDEVPNENLVTDGLPKISTSIAAAVASYTDLRSASFLAWHPKKHEMLISTRFGDTPQVHRVKFPGGARTQLTFSAEPTRVARWPRHRDDYFVFERDVGGGEFFQNYRYDVATKAITLLTDGKSRNSVGPWSHEGDRLAYTSTRRNGKDTDVWTVDPEDPATDRCAAELAGGGWHVLDWSPDDKELLLLEMISANESELWILDLASGKKTALTVRDPKEPVSWGAACFTRDGKAVLTATDKGSEFHKLCRLDRATGALVPLTAKLDWDVERFDLSPDGKTIAFVSNEDGTGVLHLIDAATGEERALPKLPAGMVHNVAFHDDGSGLLAVEISSARSPSDVWSVDLVSGAVERWTESETGNIDTSHFVEPELVKWKSFDGRTISGWLYRPPARFTGKRPVMISIHGGPESQARPGYLGQQNYFLNELGVALVFPNVRGSSGYGKTFLTLDNGFLREDAVKDVGALLDWIGTREDLDAGRVLVMGGSYGGYMSLACATHFDARLRGAIDVVGIANFVTFLERTESYRRDLRRVEYGDERDPKMRAFLTEISPANNASKITKPLFVVQGKNDPRVPLEEAEQMVAAVRKNGTKVWYLMAKDEGHGFAKKRNGTFLFHAVVEFVRENLIGERTSSQE
jgi:dipeptidyl aminopeptidase/acylaminoacyl peptidase